MNDPEIFLDELQHYADGVHAGVDRASAPPAGLWESIRSKAQPECINEETDTMSSSASIMPTSVVQSNAVPPSQEGFRHYINVAAIVAIVATVALAGWFATMQLNQPPTSNPRFAALGIQPENAGDGVCDVVPLTVDQVVAIVENPYLSVPTGTPMVAGSGTATSDSPGAEQMANLNHPWWSVMPTGERLSSPDEMIFGDALPIAKEAMDCIQFGTYGHIWALTDPAVIQGQILSTLQVYRDPDQIRDKIEILIDQPHFLQEMVFEDNKDLVVSINPDFVDARMWTREEGLYLEYSQALFIGWRGEDARGQEVFVDDWQGHTVGGDRTRSDGHSLVLAYREDFGGWFLIGVWGRA